MQLTKLLADYGYLAVFVGCLLEGETILVLAGFAAHQGYLSFPLVLVLAIGGGALGDQVFFFLGRHFGPPLITRFPTWKAPAQRVSELLRRYPAGAIIGVRFMYGLRIAGPIVIGTSDFPPLRFVLFNLLGAAIWATLVAGVGYLFGQTLQWLFADFKRYEEVALLSVSAVFIVFALVRWLYQHRQ